MQNFPKLVSTRSESLTILAYISVWLSPLFVVISIYNGSHQTNFNCFEIVHWKPVFYCFLVKRLNTKQNRILCADFYGFAISNRNAVPNERNASKETQRFAISVCLSAILMLCGDVERQRQKSNLSSWRSLENQEYYYFWSMIVFGFRFFLSINLLSALHWPC